MKIITRNIKKNDCAVVAAFNAASWCYVDKTYEEVEKLAKASGYSLKKGTRNFQFVNLIKKLNIPVKRVKPKSLDDIRSRLNSGKLFIFLYTPTGEHVGHAVSMFSDHTGKIIIVNSDAERSTWSEFVHDINTNGMKNFFIYEIPRRDLVKHNDVSRTSKNSR